jgi:hypothetical protein
MFDVSSRTAVTDVWLPLARKGSTADSHVLPTFNQPVLSGLLWGCGGGHSLLPRTFGIVARLGLLGLHFRSGLLPVIVGATATPAILLP